MHDITMVAVGCTRIFNGRVGCCIMKRRWFQIHLSTAIVLMFVGGGLSWLNFNFSFLPRSSQYLNVAASMMTTVIILISVVLILEHGSRVIVGRTFWRLHLATIAVSPYLIAGLLWKNFQKSTIVITTWFH